MSKAERITVREYGRAGPRVIVLHGGPGARGRAGPLGQGLADRFRVLEPWQRRSSDDEPLTVARHVADLDELIESRCAGVRPGLVGESWGAMLALAYAAEHPQRVGPIVLVGCGTFDADARARLRTTLDERTDDELRQHLKRLDQEYPDPAERMVQWYKLIEPLYLYDAVGEEEDVDEPFDIRGHTQTWQDMVRLQEEGKYPAAFAVIKSAVLMLHGAYDPHPGTMIRASLVLYLPQLEYRQWDRCGHSPWREKAVREEFFAVLSEWLSRHLLKETPRYA